MKNLGLVFLAAIIFFPFSAACQQSSKTESLYKVIYEADRDGNRISGSLAELIELVDNGNPVRVGWELVQKWPDTVTVMRHWTDGGFVTTLRGQVFAQIRGIFGQGFSHIDMDPGIFLSTDIPNSWVAVVGTDGNMRSKFQKQEWMNEVPEEELKKMEKMKVKTMWAVMVRE